MTTPCLAELEADVVRTADRSVVWLIGEAGLGTLNTLDKTLVQLMDERPLRVDFVLAELRSLSSLALGLLVEFVIALKRYGGQVRFISPQPDIRELLIRMRITELAELAELS